MREETAGERETGDWEIEVEIGDHNLPASPRLPVPASLLLPVPASPRLPVPASPLLPVPASRPFFTLQLEVLFCRTANVFREV